MDVFSASNVNEVSELNIKTQIICPTQEGNLKVDISIKDLLSMAAPIRTRPSFPHSQSLPSGTFHGLLSLFFRGQTE